MEQTSTEGNGSAMASQFMPLSVLFQTPPPGATAYKRESVCGSDLSITTRVGGPKGPAKFHEICDCASRDAGKPAHKHTLIRTKEDGLMDCRNRCIISCTGYSSGS